MHKTHRRVVGRVIPTSVLACCIHLASGPVLGQTPEWSLRRVVAIGSLDDPVYGLSQVRGVLTGGNHVYVLLAQEGKVRVFARSGEFVRDLGGRGEGPGELMVPSSVGWYGLRLWVADLGTRRFTLFDTTTGEAETLRYDVDDPMAYYITNLVPGAILANGWLAGSPTVSARMATARGVSHLPLLVSDTTGSLRDTLALLSLEGGPAEITTGLSDARMHVLHPLPDDDLMAFAPDGSGAALVRRRSWDESGPAGFEVARIGVLGDTLFRRRIRYEPNPVPEGYFADEISQQLDGLGTVVVDRRAFAGALREFYEKREYFPPVTRVIMGSDYSIWLAGVDEEGEREWLVLDASGASIGRVRLPATSRVSAANRTEVWIVEHDALDIPYVVRYEIVP